MAQALSIEGLAWGPRRGRPIIEDISLDVPAGSVTAIVGPNGAGKSTLLRSIYRQNRPARGVVRLDGRDIWDMPLREVSRLVAAVLQETAPDFQFTVREVVSMGRIPHGSGRAGRARNEAAIAQALDRFDLAALEGRGFSSLSGGEKQRVLLARALVQEPQLIVLDEPTNHLDIRHRLEIGRLLGGIAATVLVTLHDLNLAARLADQVLVMRAGRVVACGPPAEALTPATIRRAFDVEARIGTDAAGRPHFSFDLMPFEEHA